MKRFLLSALCIATLAGSVQPICASEGAPARGMPGIGEIVAVGGCCGIVIGATVAFSLSVYSFLERAWYRSGQKRRDLEWNKSIIKSAKSKIAASDILRIVMVEEYNLNAIVERLANHFATCDFGFDEALTHLDELCDDLVLRAKDIRKISCNYSVLRIEAGQQAKKIDGIVSKINAVALVLKEHPEFQKELAQIEADECKQEEFERDQEEFERDLALTKAENGIVDGEYRQYQCARPCSYSCCG